jgi:non-heme chloroperoxidase
MRGRTRCGSSARTDTAASRTTAAVTAVRTNQTEDLAAFDVPTLIVHGDDDQIVPIAASARRSVQLIRGAELSVYQGAPHGLCTTHKQRVNQDLLAFLKA